MSPEKPHRSVRPPKKLWAVLVFAWLALTPAAFAAAPPPTWTSDYGGNKKLTGFKNMLCGARTGTSTTPEPNSCPGGVQSNGAAPPTNPACPDPTKCRLQLVPPPTPVSPSSAWKPTATALRVRVYPSTDPFTAGHEYWGDAGPSGEPWGGDPDLSPHMRPNASRNTGCSRTS